MLRGNIRVCARVRPEAPGAAGGKAVTFPNPGAIVLHPSDRRQHEFEFDSVFDGASSQVVGRGEPPPGALAGAAAATPPKSLHWPSIA